MHREELIVQIQKVAIESWYFEINGDLSPKSGNNNSKKIGTPSYYVKKLTNLKEADFDWGVNWMTTLQIIEVQ